MYLFIFITKYETYTYVFIHKTSDLIGIYTINWNDCE